MRRERVAITVLTDYSGSMFRYFVFDERTKTFIFLLKIAILVLKILKQVLLFLTRFLGMFDIFAFPVLYCWLTTHSSGPSSCCGGDYWRCGRGRCNWLRDRLYKQCRWVGIYVVLMVIPKDSGLFEFGLRREAGQRVIERRH
mmetsp:Transcript_45934/g.129235  ORF Transcript_45934/g.129235 Transcript_45934/m.129235 type:complete len:142 (-) Transcript_45934:382-807(-)